MKKKILFLTLLFFSFTVVFANPHLQPNRKHKNFHGRRMIEDETDFHLIFAKAVENPNSILIELFFSQAINPESVSQDNLLFNGKSFPVKIIRFSKNYRSVNYLLSREDLETEDINLTIKDITSISGKTIEAVEFNDFYINAEYRYSMRDKEWKRF